AQPRGEPEDADEVEGVAVADAAGWHASPARHACHGEANEVVADGEPPELLRDAGGCLTAQQRLLALERVGFHFVKAKLDLPALEDLPLQGSLAAPGPRQPMPLVVGIEELVEERVAGKLAIDDDERALRQLRPEASRQRELTVAIGPERQPREQMTVQHHEGD